MADNSKADQEPTPEMCESGKEFLKHKIIPDVVSVAPMRLLKVQYDDNVLVEHGAELTPTQVRHQPRVEWEADVYAFYTLIMTDPDAPSRKQPKFREWHHWLVGNIPGNRVDKGEVLTAYVGSGPPPGSGLHRYVFLVYKQQKQLTFKEPRIPKTSGENRPKFNTEQFAKKYKLGNPIAGNFFQAQYDEYVPKLYKQLSGKRTN